MVGCGRNVENDESLWIIYDSLGLSMVIYESLWIIYDYLGLSMVIYESLCLFMIIYDWEVETDAGYVMFRHAYVILWRTMMWRNYYWNFGSDNYCWKWCGKVLSDIISIVSNKEYGYTRAVDGDCSC